MTVVVEAPDGGALDGSVPPLDLPVGPGMIDPGEPVLDAVLVADPIEDVVEGVFVTDMVGELDAVAPTEGMRRGHQGAVRAAFHCKRAPVEVAMASQGFSRM